MATSFATLHDRERDVAVTQNLTATSMNAMPIYDPTTQIEAPPAPTTKLPPDEILHRPDDAGVVRAGRAYCLITPCRDEAKYARQTLDAVVNQRERPAMWVVVDDGSKDETPEILAEYAAKHSWIRIVVRKDRGSRVVGAGVMEAFYHGYDRIDPHEFDYICKFDLDLDLPNGYFATLMDRMEADPRLGSCSGKPYFERDGQLVSEKCGDEHAVGMTKFYRTACFEQIGGFVRALMWDGIDTHRGRLMGWKAASWDGDDLRFTHLRPMGTSHKSWWTGRQRHGRGQYFMGTGPAYMLTSAAYRIMHPPIVLGQLATLTGYLKAMMNRTPRYGDQRFRKFLRSYQWACLFQGKRRATEALEGRMASAWQKPS